MTIHGIITTDGMRVPVDITSLSIEQATNLSQFNQLFITLYVH